jgi:lysyl-tRNA synthetase class 2
MTSSAIRGAWYLPNRRQLDLLFTSGRRYRYSDVPSHIATGFAQAMSKGRFYNAEIRDKYAFTEIDADLPKVA